MTKINVSAFFENATLRFPAAALPIFKAKVMII
jgi:hypothetical protein